MASLKARGANLAEEQKIREKAKAESDTAELLDGRVYSDGRETPPGQRQLQADGTPYPWWNKGGRWDLNHDKMKKQWLSSANSPKATLVGWLTSTGVSMMFIGGAYAFLYPERVNAEWYGFTYASFDDGSADGSTDDAAYGGLFYNAIFSADDSTDGSADGSTDGATAGDSPTDIDVGYMRSVAAYQLLGGAVLMAGHMGGSRAAESSYLLGLALVLLATAPGVEAAVGLGPLAGFIASCALLGVWRLLGSSFAGSIGIFAALVTGLYGWLDPQSYYEGYEPKVALSELPSDGALLVALVGLAQAHVLCIGLYLIVLKPATWTYGLLPRLKVEPTASKHGHALLLYLTMQLVCALKFLAALDVSDTGEEAAGPLIFITTALVLAALLAYALRKSFPGPDGPAALVRKMVSEGVVAAQSNDETAVDTFMKTYMKWDAQIIRPSGNPMDQATWKGMLTSADMQVISDDVISVDKVSEYANGQIAVVVFTTRSKFTYKGKQNDDIAKFSATMEKQADGKWQIVHNHRGTGQVPQ